MNYSSKETVDKVVRYLNRAEMYSSDIDNFCLGYIHQKLAQLTDSPEESQELSEFLFKLQSAIGYDLGK
jgi:hypothetical protein